MLLFDVVYFQMCMFVSASPSLDCQCCWFVRFVFPLDVEAAASLASRMDDHAKKGMTGLGTTKEKEVGVVVEVGQVAAEGKFDLMSLFNI